MDIRIFGSILVILVMLLVAPVQADSQEWTTAGTYSWTIPDDVSSITATIVGGGGGGKGGLTFKAAYGGSAGQIRTGVSISVTPGSSLQIIVGSGGSGGSKGEASSSGNGGNGGVSSVGGEQATGGAGATAVFGSMSDGGSGANGYGSGSFAGSGENGTIGAPLTGTYGGAGGTGYGAGGGGGGAGGAINQIQGFMGGSGGSGAQGYVSITYTVVTPTPTTVPPTPTPAPSADTWYTTPGTYTWTCPAGVHYVNVTMAAGGGGGAAGSGSEYGWGGYAGQYRDVKRVKVTPGETYTIRVGAGGASGQWGQQSQFGPITAIQGAPGPGTLAESTSSGENGRNDSVSLASAGSSGGSGGTGYGAGGGGGGLSSSGGTGGSGFVALDYGYTVLGFPYNRNYAYNPVELLDQANYLNFIGLFGAVDTGRALEDGPAGEDVDWSKIIGISLNPFETHLGAHLAMVIIFSIPFIMQWLMQGNSIVPAVSGMVLGILIITLLPADYYLVAVTFIALSILAVIYSLLKERM